MVAKYNAGMISPGVKKLLFVFLISASVFKYRSYVTSGSILGVNRM